MAHAVQSVPSGLAAKVTFPRDPDSGIYDARAGEGPQGNAAATNGAIEVERKEVHPVSYCWSHPFHIKETVEL